ncbi:cation-transporting P-type ATPase [bacterium]|nr:cation-transporting P-type ATPase [bacterium]MBU1883550.1 cation-transporting P-type ATPase [bacterium]
MKAYQLSPQKLFKEFRTGQEGLSTSDVAKRQRDFGKNLIERKEKKNYLKEYFKQYIEFFPILLEIAGVLAFIAEYYQPDQGNNILGYAIFGAVIINASFTFWQNFKADKAMDALLKLMPTIIKVKREGKILEVDASELVPGDLIVLEEGDKIAADAVLLEANELYINISSLNGESKPSRRELTSEHAKREIDAKNMVYAGTSVVNGSGEAIVVATSMATEFGKIATLTNNIEKGLTPLEKEVINMTKILTVLALLAGVVFFLLGYFSGKGILIAAIFALSLIVANVPEGLLPTITLSLSLASQRMAKKNALIKNLASVQTLGSVTTICTDKTGTLTKNEMTLKEIYLTSGEKISISGNGYDTIGEFSINNESENSKEHLKTLLKAGLFNSRASIDENNKIIGDPTELAIVVAAKKYNVENGFQKIKENPFSSERKMMSTFGNLDGKEILCVKGAPEVIFAKISHYQDKNERKTFDEDTHNRVQKELEDFENKAYRVLAIAVNDKDDEENLTLIGLVAIMDIARPEVKDALTRCYTAGIRTIMITGDNANTAAAIGKQIGLKYDGVVTGNEVAQMSSEELEYLLEEKTVIFARMASNQKLKIAEALQKNGEVVAMTGDGVNDSPSLKKADIGIAMGSGTDVAKESSDMILLDDNFNSIVSAIEEGRTVYFNIKKFVTYILSSNVPEIVPYILSFFLKIPNPLSVIQILSIDLGSDMLPGLALGSEKPEKNIMKRPPVGKDEKILDWEVFKRGYFFIGVIEASAAMFAFMSFLLSHGWQYGQVDLHDPVFHAQAMTMTLLGAITSQLANAWTMRSWDFNIWTISWKSNKTLLFAWAVVLVWIYMLLNVEAVQKVFNTAHVPLNDLWILLPFPILVLVAHESYKYIRLKKMQYIDI